MILKAAMILKAWITLIFVGAALLKLTGRVAPNWDRCRMTLEKAR